MFNVICYSTLVISILNTYLFNDNLIINIFVGISFLSLLILAIVNAIKNSKNTFGCLSCDNEFKLNGFNTLLQQRDILKNTEDIKNSKQEHMKEYM